VYGLSNFCSISGCFSIALLISGHEEVDSSDVLARARSVAVKGHSWRKTGLNYSLGRLGDVPRAHDIKGPTMVKNENKWPTNVKNEAKMRPTNLEIKGMEHIKKGLEIESKYR